MLVYALLVKSGDTFIRLQLSISEAARWEKFTDVWLCWDVYDLVSAEWRTSHLMCDLSLHTWLVTSLTQDHAATGVSLIRCEAALWHKSWNGEDNRSHPVQINNFID